METVRSLVFLAVIPLLLLAGVVVTVVTQLALLPFAAFYCAVFARCAGQRV